MKRAVAILLLMMLWGLSAAGQVRKISGRVLDPDGQPVIAAGAVCPEKPSVGTVTDLDGRFTLSVPDGVSRIRFSAVGMQPVDYTLQEDGAGDITIVLPWEENTLDQVVVTGYAQTTVKRITGSVGILDKETFEAKPLASVGALMQGEIAGVQIQAVSGQPGTQSRIRIRGTNKISGSGSPLWVVDGVPLQNDSPNLTSEQLATGGFDDIFVSGVGGINPGDIESVTVLKDAAAAAIYGSRAANGVIVVTTRRGQSGKMRVSYNNNFTWSFRPQRSLDLMDAGEKLDWEQTLWDEFSAAGFAAGAYYPVIGIVGQVRSGAGPFAGMDAAARDAYLQGLRGVSTNWYDILLRNAFSHNHHLSISGGADRYTYYVSGGVNDENGMLRSNNYRRYNLTANMTMTPSDRVRLEVGVDASRQKSRSPDSSVNPFTYAYFANPYERAWNADGSYASDNTFFSLGYYNGRGVEQVMPDEGFSILRELDNNYTATTNSALTLRGQLDVKLWEPLHFVGLASYSYSSNETDKVVEKSTYTAFRDRLGNDDKSQGNRYGNIAQNRTGRNSYVLRGHFAFNKTFGSRHTLNALAGAEIRGSSSNTIYSKRYNYDPVTGTSSLPPISGPADQWLSQVERLNGQYFTENRYASFYASIDYFLGRTLVLNASVRTDGSSNFGSKRQFNPTWSAGAAWHLGEERWMPSVISHATLRAAYGFTGDISTSTTHQLVMRYLQQEYRYYGKDSYMLGTIPSAPNPNLGWEKTSDAKIGLDFGLWKDRLTVNTEAYYRFSSDVVSSTIVQSTTGFTSVYVNSADIANTGVELTLSGKILQERDYHLSASVNVAYNANKVVRYRPSWTSGITSRDRYVEGYPVGAIISGEMAGIDRTSGLYAFRLRDDATLRNITDLNNPDNYRIYLGTTIAPVSGGFNISAGYKWLRLSISGVYSLGGKVFDRIVSPASYLNALHNGLSTEEIQSQYSDLYSNHLNVTRDRTDRWTASNNFGVKYPRIYDRFDARYNFAASNPMDFSILDAIYLKDVSYLRIKSILLSASCPESWVKALHLRSLSFHLSLGNFLTFTSYDGMDPEVPGATYPTTRSLSCGLSLEF